MRACMVALCPTCTACVVKSQNSAKNVPNDLALMHFFLSKNKIQKKGGKKGYQPLILPSAMNPLLLFVSEKFFLLLDENEDPKIRKLCIIKKK